jgi:RNA polymerase sigma factor (sigma-70 family)
MSTSAGAARGADQLWDQSWDPTWAARWGLTIELFRATLAASIGHAFSGQHPTTQEVDRYVASLRLDDLALASACAAGLEPAWDHFVREYRPLLYRASDAIDPTGGARELADALYADLFGLREREGARQSLFRYFHGRSSLATWLRAVLSQRHIDRLRAGRRLDPLPDDDAAPAGRATPSHASGTAPDPDRRRYVHAMRVALAAAIAALAPRDRLRLALYYAQDMTLAAIGRLLSEHEATVSRHLTRTRGAVRQSVEQCLRKEHGFDEHSVAECFRSVVDDAGPLDLGEIVGAMADLMPEHEPHRKNKGQDRSK